MWPHGLQATRLPCPWAFSSKEYCVCVCVCVKLLSHVRLFATPWTVAHQAPPSMRFSRQEYWSGLPFPSPGDLPNLGTEPSSPALLVDSLPSEPPGKPSKPAIQKRKEKKKSLNPRKRERPSLDIGSTFLRKGCPLTGFINWTGWTRSFFHSSLRIWVFSWTFAKFAT